MSNLFNFSVVIAGLFLLFIVSTKKSEVACAQTADDIFSSGSGRSCPRSAASYANDEKYRSEPILLTLDELNKTVYPHGKQSPGTPFHKSCALVRASGCENLYWCWPDKSSLPRPVIPPEPVKPTPKQDVSDACRKNPQSYTCLYGHKDVIAKNPQERPPLEGGTEQNVRFTWKDWCEDWQKKFDLVAEEVRKARPDPKDRYRCDITLTILPDGGFKPGKYHESQADLQRNRNFCASIMNRYLHDPDLRPLGFPPSYKTPWKLTMTFERTSSRYSRPCQPPPGATEDLR